MMNFPFYKMLQKHYFIDSTEFSFYVLPLRANSTLKAYSHLSAKRTSKDYLHLRAHSSRLILGDGCTYKSTPYSVPEEDNFVFLNITFKLTDLIGIYYMNG